MNIDVKIIPAQYSAEQLNEEVLLSEEDVQKNNPLEEELIILYSYNKDKDRYIYGLYMATWKRVGYTWRWAAVSLCPHVKE